MQSKNRVERSPLITLIFSVVIFFLLLDFIAGQIFIIEELRPCNLDYSHDLKKNLKVKDPWGLVDCTLFTNSLGFKDNKNRNIELVSDKYRILFIGDSFTEGVGYPYDSTFVGLFAQRLNKEKFEVLNAAVVGYSPKIYYLKLKYLLESKGLRFNELFVFIDISDIRGELFYKDFCRGRIDLRQQIDLFLRNNFYFMGDLKARLRIGLRFRTILARLFSRLGNQKKMDDLIVESVGASAKLVTEKESYEKWGRKGFTLAEQNMHLVYELCRKYNIKMQVAVYPWPCQIKNRDLNSIQVRFWENFCRQRQIGFLNYSPYFINDEEDNKIIAKYFIEHDVHWNEAGHKLIADVLYGYWSNAGGR